MGDVDELITECRRREERTGKPWGHYRSALNAAQRVLFHLGIVDVPPPHWQRPMTFAERVVDVSPALRPAFVAYLNERREPAAPRP